MKKAFFILLAVIFLFQFPCFAKEEWIVDDEAAMLPPDPREQARYLAGKMSMEEKVGQLIMVSPEDLTGEKRTDRIPDAQAFSSLPVGGVILYGQNITSAEQLKALTNDILFGCRENGLYTPFIAVDEEGGSVIRVANKLGLPSAPSAEEIGRTGDYGQAYLAGHLIGIYLKEFGINLDLAPVADVHVVDSPEIAGRTYGSDPIVVAEMANNMANGLNDAGIIACYKHFPGHGTITRNTHNVSTGHDRPLEQMLQTELIPFELSVYSGAEMVMVSHLTARSLDADRPASLSPVMIDNLLRDKLGFDGVVITDALRMGAIGDEYSTEEAAVMAILAGADIVLAPDDGKTVYEALLSAVKRGVISPERLDLSVERILALKIESGLIQ